MSDLISRQAAVDALRTCYDTEAITYTNGNEYIDYDQALDLINALPSAQPGWIPVTERLPKAENMYQTPEQRYLCQLEAYGEKKFCVLSRLKGAISPFWDWYGVAVHDSEVTAWMPLPKPYEGSESDDV